MRELKNPGLEEPKLLNFDEIPSLFEFLARGGWPGCEYLFTAAENMPKAQSEGWQMIVGVPFFSVGGIGSSLMARGTPLTGTPAQPGTSKCPIFADDKLLAAVGKAPTIVVATPVEAPETSNPTPQAPVAPKHRQTSSDLLK